MTPTKTSKAIVQMIHDRIAVLTQELGEPPTFVFVSPFEYAALKEEICTPSYATLVSLDGVALIVRDQDPSWAMGIGPLNGIPALLDNAESGTWKGFEHIPNAFAGFNEAVKNGLIAPPKVYHQHSKDDWGTEQAFFDVCNGECPFDLDVCATTENSKCEFFLSPEMDALSMSWFGKVWMNPPYSQVAKFIVKLIQELEAGNIEKAWVLVAARTDTQWFQAASSYAGEIRFLKGRLKFEMPGAEGKKLNSAPFPSALMIFDKTITNQRVVFWDWKKGIKTSYAYQKYGLHMIPFKKNFADFKASKAIVDAYVSGATFKLT